jgi:RNA polymerase sigma-B factor
MPVESQMRHRARGGVARAGPAPAARDRLLFRRYRDERDPIDREELLRRFMPLARQVASSYAGGTEPYDDLLQVACLALVRAIDRFDPGRGVAFSSYAVPTIGGELKRHYRDKTWAVRVPRDLQDRAMSASRARDCLSATLGRAPTAGELSAHMDVDEGDLLEALRAGDAHTATSLELPRPEQDADLTLRDSLPYHERGYEVVDARESLDHLLCTLSRRDREILRLRFEEDLTQREIGARIGLSQMHVSRIIRGAVGQLGEAAALAATGG